MRPNNSSHTICRFLLAPAVAAALLASGPGCSSGSHSKSTKPAKGTPFTVTDTEPAGGAAGVSTDAAIRVTFSEDVDFKTVSSTTFEVEGSSSGKKSGAYSHAAGSKSVTFTPASGFSASETVHVRLKDGIRSLSKARLQRSELSFAVAAGNPPPPPPPPPGSALAVTSSTPRPFESDVSLDHDVSVVFSEAVDPSLVSGATVWLASESSGRIAAVLELLDQGLRLRITPGRALQAGEAVSVNLSREIKAASGASFPGWSFQFHAMTVAPPRERALDHVFTAVGKVSRLLSGDLNLDGVADAVYAAENEMVIDVLLGRGDGTFIPALRVDAGQPVLSLLLADVDADGDADILLGTQDRCRVFLNRSVENGPPPPDSITFAEGPIAPTGTAVRNVAVGDLDHQGLPDVVLDTDRGLVVHLGGLAAPATQTLGSSRQSRTQLILADLDLDGQVDIVFGDRRGSRVSYYLSTGSREKPFDGLSSVNIGTDAEQLAVEDLDRNGAPEIVVLTVEGASLLGAAFRVLTRAGDTYSVERGDSAAAAGAGVGAADDVLDTGRFALADLDGDGRPDLVLAAAAIGKVTWFPNRGGRFDFTNGAEILSFPEAWATVAADLTNDGSLDILSAGSHEIHALLPLEEAPPPPPGKGTFQLKIDETQARQKDTNATTLVRLTNTKPLQAYSVVIGYDARVLTPVKISTDGTITGQSAVEFSDTTFYATESALRFNVIVDLEPPFEGRVLPAGEDQLLFRLHYDVLATAPLGESSFQFLDGAGDPPFPTSVVVEGESVTPDTTPGKLVILPPKAPPPPPDGNRMQLGSTQVAPGEEGTVAVLGTLETNAEAFTSIVSFDKSVLEVLDLVLEGSVTEELHADLVVPTILNDEGHALITVLFDFLPPFDRQTIPPGSDLLLFTVKLRARADAVTGSYPIGFENRVGSPPLNNIFVFSGESVFPELVAGQIQIGGDTPPVFLRGDFDASGALVLSDAVAVVNYLFKGGSAPACGDAADADDNGLIDLTDAVRLLNYLFKGGPPPATPYPDPGTDPTPDALDCSPHV